MEGGKAWTPGVAIPVDSWLPNFLPKNWSNLEKLQSLGSSGGVVDEFAVAGGPCGSAEHLGKFSESVDRNLFTKISLVGISEN